MLTVLIFHLCLINHPTECIDLRQVPDDDHEITLFECFAQAQPMAEKVLESHPGYRLAKWKCSFGVPEKKDT